jgi:hypothetical protein
MMILPVSKSETASYEMEVWRVDFLVEAHTHTYNTKLWRDKKEDGKAEQVRKGKQMARERLDSV